jgi:DNA-binding CsgD family transcriptional regulator/tetratricopeptide (TPR) repeat protein
VSELLEREGELEIVQALLDACVAGEGSFLVVEGPAGIGKSSLLAAGRARAGAAGLSVLQARGSELEQAFAYGLVRQLFEPVVPREPTERATVFREAAARATRVFVPDVDDTPAGGDEAFALVHGLYWLTINVSESRPLLLVVDDLQWADNASLRWLGYLTRRIEGHPIGVLAAARPSADEDPLLSELLTDRATTVVRPNTLSTTAVATLARSVVSEHAEEAFSLACHAATGGNPLLVHELLRTLAAEAVPATAASVPIVETTAPDAVTRSVNVRLSRLGDDAQAIAAAVAVLGDGAEPNSVAQMAELDPTALAAAAAALSRAHLFAPGTPPRFVHPLVRNAVYKSIAPSDRLQHHARAAELLASTAAPAETIAAQLLNAPPRTVHGAIENLVDAAKNAAARGAPDSAATYLARALDEPVDDAQRLGLLVELAEAELDLGRATALARLREAVALAPDVERRTFVRRKLARALFWWRRPDEAIEVLEAAVAEQPAADDLTRHVEAELLAIAVRSRRLQTDVHERLDSLEPDTGGGPGALLLLGLRAYLDAVRGRQRVRAVADARRAIAAAPSDIRRTASWAYGPALYVLLFGDELDELIGHFDAVTEAAREESHVFAFANAVSFRARVRYLRAELYDAEADARLARDTQRDQDVIIAPYLVGLLAEVLIERRADEEAADLVGHFDLGPVDELSRTPLLRARGALAAARGDHRRALAEALQVGEILEALGYRNPAVSSWRSDAALAHFFLGAEGDAHDLASQEIELAREWGAPRALGRALRVVGLIETGEEGIGRLRNALEVLEDSSARLEYLYALTQLGAALRRANRRAEAREPLRRALDLAERGGATRVAELAHAELVATGARPRRRRASGVDALTPSERRIAAMAASGLSNREIAQGLFVTLRTVEMHMSSVFRKLGVKGRTELPAALAGAGAFDAASSRGGTATHS